MLRADGAPRFADLIAQKQRLQQLEAEYALKIQKLKEKQAQRQQAEQQQRAALPQQPPPQQQQQQHQQPQHQRQSPATSPFPLPQPSLHDLTQDKLALGSEDLEGDDEEEEEQLPAFAASLTSSPVLASSATAAASAPGTPATPTGRRRSFRDSGAFTKPKLQVPKALQTSTPAKGAKAAKTAKGSGGVGPDQPELYLGLSLEELKQRYQNAEGLDRLLQSELAALGGAVSEKAPRGKV